MMCLCPWINAEQWSLKAFKDPDIIDEGEAGIKQGEI